MGAGKTRWVLQEINAHPERLYLCIVPLRKEIERYREAINTKTYTPICFSKDRQKLDNLKELIEMGVNIVSTHALFLNVDSEVIELLKLKNYHLVIDEALSVTAIISKPKKGAENNDDENANSMDDIPKLDPEEIDWLITNNSMEVLPDNSVRWLAKPTGYHKYLWVENLARNNALTYVNGAIMMWCFPPIIFDMFSDTYVLTYLFSSSLMRSYMQLYKIQYEIKGVTDIGDGTYQLTTYNANSEKRGKYADLINICNDDSLNSIGVKSGKSFPLSLSWYRTNSKGKKLALKALRNNAYTYLRHRLDAPRESVMWTTYKRFAESVCPPSYKTIDEAQKIPSFVSCNAKATNDYKERYNLVYLCDRHIDPNIARFFEAQGVSVDRSGFSLGELLQWIFRSRIRDGESINIYLPSERMKKLLLDWMACR